HTRSKRDWSSDVCLPIFGKVDNSLFYINAKYHTIYERMVDAGRTAKIYYFDDSSSTIALAFLLLKQPKLFGTFDDFLHDCKSGRSEERRVGKEWICMVVK